MIIYLEGGPGHYALIRIHDEGHLLIFGGVRHGKFGCPQGEVVFESLRVAAVTSVAEERAFERCHLHADLVGSAGGEPDFHKGKAMLVVKHVVVQFRPFRAVREIGND